MPSRILALSFLCVALTACDTNRDDSSSDAADASTPPNPTCQLQSTVELDGPDTLAPNGRTGADLLSQIPDTFQTTLHWVLSTSQVEVEVVGASGPSSTLDLGFSLSADPKFYFDDWEAVRASGEIVTAVDVFCDDYIRTSIDITADTQDGALDLTMSGVDVRLGTDDPTSGAPLTPFVLDTQQRESPQIDFVTPVAQAADAEKTVAFSFDGAELTGSIMAYATASDDTHFIVVAKW